jgi:hypothetical protein
VASRFWVGGTGNWTDTAHWAATSGGAGGVSFPTGPDDVFFDANSGTGIATIDTATQNCRSLDCTGYTGTLTFGTSLNVNAPAGGSCKFSAGMTLSGSGTLGLIGGTSASPATLTCAGKSIPNVNVSTTTSAWTCADAFSVTGALTLTSGTLNTNGQTCSWGSFNSNNSNVRTLTLGASSITITSAVGGIAWDVTAGTNLTITANTATVTMTATGSVTFRTGARNWNGLSLVFNGFTVAAVISQNGTLANVTVTGPANKTSVFETSSGTTIASGTLTITSNSATNRVFYNGNGTVGATVGISAATTALSNVDFMDVAASGAAAWTGTSLGDCGGNSGITFTASATQTWQGTAGGSWSDVTKWTSRVPLPQDDVLIASAFVAGQTITADMPRLGRSINFTGSTGNPIFKYNAAPCALFGSLTFVAGMATTSSAGGLTFAGRGSYTVTSAGVTFSSTPTFQAPGGTYTLLDNFATANGVIGMNVTAGTFDANDFNVTAAFFLSSGVLARTVTMRSGVFTLFGTGAITAWSVTGSGTTLNPGTSIIDITGADGLTKTFAGGSLTYGTLRYRPAGAGSLVITGSNTFAGLDLEATSARTVTLPAAGNQQVPKILTLRGAAGQLLSFVSSTPGTATTITAPDGTLALVDNATISLSADVTLSVQNKGLYESFAGAAATQYVVSAWVWGAGTVRVALWDDVTGKQTSSAVTLSSVPQKITKTAVSGAGSTSFALLVETDVAQSVTFNVDDLKVRSKTTAPAEFGVFYGFLRRAQWQSQTRACQLYFEDLLFRLTRVYPIIPSTGPSTTGAAIGLVLDAAGWTWPEWRLLATGDAIDDFSADGSRTARNLLDDLIAAERGTIFVRGDGVFVYESRGQVQTRHAAWTLAATSPAAPTPDANLEDFESGIDADSILTRATVTRTDPGGILADVTWTATDALAEQRYGRGDVPAISSPYVPAANGQDLADDLVYSGVQGGPPFTANVFAIDDETLNDILASALQTVVAVDDPLAGTEGDFVIQRASHILDTGQHRTSYTLTKRAARSYALDSQLDGPDVFRY